MLLLGIPRAGGMLLPGTAAILELFNMPGAGAMLWPGTMLELGGMPGTMLELGGMPGVGGMPGPGGWGRGVTLFVGPGGPK